MSHLGCMGELWITKCMGDRLALNVMLQRKYKHMYAMLASRHAWVHVIMFDAVRYKRSRKDRQAAMFDGWANQYGWNLQLPVPLGAEDVKQNILTTEGHVNWSWVPATLEVTWDPCPLWRRTDSAWIGACERRKSCVKGSM